MTFPTHSKRKWWQVWKRPVTLTTEPEATPSQPRPSEHRPTAPSQTTLSPSVNASGAGATPALQSLFHRALATKDTRDRKVQLDALRAGLRTLLADVAASSVAERSLIEKAGLKGCTADVIVSGDTELLGLLLEEGVPSSPNDLAVALLGPNTVYSSYNENVIPDMVGILLECGHASHRFTFMDSVGNATYSHKPDVRDKFEMVLDMLLQVKPSGDRNFKPIRPAKGVVSRARGSGERARKKAVEHAKPSATINPMLSEDRKWGGLAVSRDKIEKLSRELKSLGVSVESSNQGTAGANCVWLGDRIPHSIAGPAIVSILRALPELRYVIMPVDGSASFKTSRSEDRFAFYVGGVAGMDTFTKLEAITPDDLDKIAKVRSNEDLHARLRAHYHYFAT